ncbi:hypothetical protein OAM25_02530 [Gammaproteobacteria bacterium]|nr:hypothetical protein [Gammaproteobacteria bacterium]
MKKYTLKDMTKGWFVGDFKPNVITSKDVEVAVKLYKKGDYEEKHLHKISTEITVITSGKVKMNNTIYSTGDIIVIEPYEATDFEAIEDTSTTVVKIPSSSDDKYLADKQ